MGGRVEPEGGVLVIGSKKAKKGRRIGSGRSKIGGKIGVNVADGCGDIKGIGDIEEAAGEWVKSIVGELISGDGKGRDMQLGTVVEEHKSIRESQGKGSQVVFLRRCDAEGRGLRGERARSR